MRKQFIPVCHFNMSRSASYFESGIGRGMGFRDSCQDLLGFVHLIPDRARERILDIAATQFEDGSAYHQYQPLTKKGNSDIGSGFNDDPLWLIAGTAAYIKETGDYTILDEKTPYDSDPSKATDFMEHLRRSFHYTIDHLGPHKLPLIGRADWNDCLNLNCFSTEPGESFQTFGPSEGPNAESVFIAGMFVRYGKDYVEICRHRGLEDEAKLAEDAIAEMEKTVLNAGWDPRQPLSSLRNMPNFIYQPPEVIGCRTEITHRSRTCLFQEPVRRDFLRSEREGCIFHCESAYLRVPATENIHIHVLYRLVLKP